MSAVNSWDDLKSVLAQAQEARAKRDEMRAQTLYVRATQLDPNNPTAWAGRAAMSVDPDDAIVAWSHALALTPSDENARAVLAQRIQERLAASNSGDADDLIALGRDVAKAGQKEFAHTLFVRATELAATNAEAWVWRAGSAESLEEQVSDLNYALVLDPENKRARSGLHWILAEKVAATQFASPQMVRQAAQQLAEGQRLLSGGVKSEALEHFARATELDHRNEAAWLWRASATQDVDQALLYVEQALRLNPANTAAHEARNFLRARKLNLKPAPLPPASEPIAPIQLPETGPAPNPRTRILILAIALVLLILIVYSYLKTTGIVR